MTNNPDIHQLEFGQKKITLIGTAHISRQSVNLVEEIIKEEKPETVCIELCQSRYQSLTQKDNWQKTDLIKVIREKKAFLLLINLLLASFQKRIGNQLGIKPGEEIIKAIEISREISAQIHLVDREIRTTLSRVWRLMSLWTKIKLMFQFVISIGRSDSIQEEDIEKLKSKDVLEMLLAEVGETLPELRMILIDERDKYLAQKIRTAPGEKIVAVVGAGHVPGLIKNWNEPVDIPSLEKLPPHGSLSSLIKWGLPVTIILMITWGFSNFGISAGTDMLKWWIIANAILSGLGAAVALAHPLTILIAIIAAPFTSLNPMIAAGWVAGIAEVFLRKPQVKDFEALSEDIASVKGFWSNKITRILLIVVFTNLGSSLGTFVAIPLMAKVFT